MWASVLTAALLANAPMADVWPFQARRLPDGSIEYTYDFTALKASSGLKDAREEHGDEKVKAFLASLPRQTVVVVRSGAPVALSGGQGLESAPLAASFAQTPDGPLASENPLGRKTSARLLAPLDPRTPKVLVGAELPLWLARQLEDGALAAVELDSESLRRDLWSKVTEQALASRKKSLGDTREGALALLARLYAGASCGEPAKMPAAAKNDPELRPAVEAELLRLSEDGDNLVAPAPWSWSAELSCAWVRNRVMSRPFDHSRAGTAAVLLFIEMLEKNPPLNALWERVRKRRDRFVGAPTEEPILGWKASTKGDAAKALDGLADFIEALPIPSRRPPALLAWPTTPFSRFVSELSGVERGAAMDELASAVADKRVSFPDKAESWPIQREAAIAMLLADGARAVQIDSGWRDRLSGAFAALQGSHRDARGGGLDTDDEVPERTKLQVRLNVPPLLEVEPTAAAFERQARSLELLVQTLTAESLTSLQALTGDGKRSGTPIVVEARRLALLLAGLSSLAQVGSARVEGPAVTEARRFLSAWRGEPGVDQDVRAMFAAPWVMGSERSQCAIVGVSRRELKVGFAGPVAAQMTGERKGLIVNTSVEQRYLVPVLVTAGVTTRAATRPLPRARLRAIVDGAGRDVRNIDAALSASLAE